MRDADDPSVTTHRVEHRLTVASQTFVVDRSGALYWPAENTLIVADLHFEKGSAFARRGWMLPPYDTRETLARLSAALASFRPARIIALGDSLHDPDGVARIDASDFATLRSLQEKRRWIWITGNHDPMIDNAFGGEIMSEFVAAGIRFVHEPSATLIYPEIAGHLHPAAKLISQGVGIRRPCFIGDGRRLIMPAFGAFTGGLNICDSAVSGLFPADNVNVVMLGTDGVYPIPMNKLAPD